MSTLYLYFSLIILSSQICNGENQCDIVRRVFFKKKRNAGPVSYKMVPNVLKASSIKGFLFRVEPIFEDEQIKQSGTSQMFWTTALPILVIF